MSWFVRASIASLIFTVAPGCKSPSSAVSAPMDPRPVTPVSAASASATVGAGGRPPIPSATALDDATGELTLAREVTFEVRPLNGPGTMGPRVLSASSEGALEEVRSYLAAHPDAGPLRVEGAANPRTMSGMPTPRWPAGLALQVARWLVDHGIDCRRLTAVGRLDSRRESPGERVRFFLARDLPRDAAAEARLDVCDARD